MKSGNEIGMSMAACTHGDKVHTSTVERLRLILIEDTGHSLKERQVFSGNVDQLKSRQSITYSISVYSYCCDSSAIILKTHIM